MADDAPPDTVYLLEELTAEDRPLYEEVAMMGWKRMDDWMQKNRQMQLSD